MSKYPIAVRRYDDQHPSDLTVCGACGRKYDHDPAEGDPYDLCLKCPVCNGPIVYAYEEVDACKNCDALGHGKAEVDGCCSRRCALQWEYAQNLKATA